DVAGGAAAGGARPRAVAGVQRRTVQGVGQLRFALERTLADPGVDCAAPARVPEAAAVVLGVEAVGLVRVRGVCLAPVGGLAVRGMAEAAARPELLVALEPAPVALLRRVRAPRPGARHDVRGDEGVFGGAVDRGKGEAAALTRPAG